jgi:hypothetical protein
MTEKKFKYTAKIKQPQTVVEVKLDPKGGFLSEREIKTVKKDAYGASLLEKGLLVIEGEPARSPSGDTKADGEVPGEAIPDFDGSGASPDRPKNHTGGKAK